MNLPRIIKVIISPLLMLYARLHPAGYARFIGVNMTGNVTIYHSSYAMFGSEPFLVTLGNNVHIAPHACLVCHDGGVAPFKRDTPDLDIAKPIKIGNNCFIGMGAIVLPGVSIGDNCIIGAHAVVTKDIPDNSVAAGNPARIIKSIDDYLDKARHDSLHLGHLSGTEKNNAYKKIFESITQDTTT